MDIQTFLNLMFALYIILSAIMFNKQIDIIHTLIKTIDKMENDIQIMDNDIQIKIMNQEKKYNVIKELFFDYANTIITKE